MTDIIADAVALSLIGFLPLRFGGMTAALLPAGVTTTFLLPLCPDFGPFAVVPPSWPETFPDFEK